MTHTEFSIHNILVENIFIYNGKKCSVLANIALITDMLGKMRTLFSLTTLINNNTTDSDSTYKTIAQPQCLYDHLQS